MATTRLQSISEQRPRGYASSGEREGNILTAIRDAYLLDTSAGQFTIMAATASAFGARRNGDD